MLCRPRAARPIVPSARPSAPPVRSAVRPDDRGRVIWSVRSGCPIWLRYIGSVRSHRPISASDLRRPISSSDLIVRLRRPISSSDQRRPIDLRPSDLIGPSDRVRPSVRCDLVRPSVRPIRSGPSDRAGVRRTLRPPWADSINSGRLSSSAQMRRWASAVGLTSLAPPHWVSA